MIALTPRRDSRTQGNEKEERQVFFGSKPSESYSTMEGSCAAQDASEVRTLASRRDPRFMYEVGADYSYE